MKRYLTMFLCFIFLLEGCNFIKWPDNVDKSKEQDKNTVTSAVNTMDITGTIIYGRYGQMKEVCSIKPAGEDFTELYQGDYDIISGFNDKIVVNSIQDDKGEIYLYDNKGRELDLIAEGFRFVHKPAFSPDGTQMAFYAYNTTSSERFKARIYYMNFKDVQPHKIDNITEEVKHLSFWDEDRIIYAKKDDKNNNQQYQIFSYSLKDETETQVMESASNDVNPVVSPDGKYMAFLSDRYRNYNLFVLNLEDHSILELDLNDAVVGESLVWSKNSDKIAYVALNGVTNYSIKLANIKDKSAATIDDGYAVSFSPSGESIIYASYSIDNEKEVKRQVIYKRELGSSVKEEIWDFPEESLYSRSINMLYWTEKLDI